MQEIVRRILEAARAVGGDPPRAKFVRSSRVIRRALEMVDDLSPASRRALTNEINPWTPAVERYHDVLVRLVYGPSTWEPYLEGEGNFGQVCVGYPDCPAAHPLYTRCRITAHALQWLEDNPEPAE